MVLRVGYVNESVVGCWSVWLAAGMHVPAQEATFSPFGASLTMVLEPESATKISPVPRSRANPDGELSLYPGVGRMLQDSVVLADEVGAVAPLAGVGSRKTAAVSWLGGLN